MVGDLTAPVFMAAVTAVAVSTAANTSRNSHGGKHFHGRVGVFVGAPVVFGGWAYASPYYYYPRPAYYYPWAPYYPPAYIEQGYGRPVPEQQPAPGYWYYCPDAKAYYPYIKECPGGWQQVVPEPPPPPS